MHAVKYYISDSGAWCDDSGFEWVMFVFNECTQPEPLKFNFMIMCPDSKNNSTRISRIRSTTVHHHHMISSHRYRCIRDRERGCVKKVNIDTFLL